MKYPGMIKSKMPKTGTTIFSVMSGLANETGAINLSQGFPDFQSSAKLIELVNAYMKKGYNQYSPLAGVPKLREVIAEKTEKLYGAQYDPGTEVTVTAGATIALFTAISAVIREGDEVLIFEPAYDCYVPAIELNGGVPVYSQLKAPHYKIQWDEVQKLVNPRTRMIILNSPHNPTGAVLSKEDMRQLEKLTKGTNIVILSDEVYEHIIFDGQQHESVARYPKMAERSFVVSSFGKTFHNTGWKMGYVLAPADLMKEYQKVHQYLIFCVNTPIQHALADYIKDESTYMNLSDFYQEKRDYFNELVKDSRFKLEPSGGTYFQLLNYSDITNEKDTDYAVRLTKEAGVASIPISVFYHEKLDEHFLRFCFAKEKETLEKAAELLRKVE